MPRRRAALAEALPVSMRAMLLPEQRNADFDERFASIPARGGLPFRSFRLTQYLGTLAALTFDD